MHFALIFRKASLNKINEDKFINYLRFKNLFKVMIMQATIQ